MNGGTIGNVYGIGLFGVGLVLSGFNVTFFRVTIGLGMRLIGKLAIFAT